MTHAHPPTIVWVYGTRFWYVYDNYAINGSLVVLGIYAMVVKIACDRIYYCLERRVTSYHLACKIAVYTVGATVAIGLYIVAFRQGRPSTITHC
jgi:hypothetical protein